MLEAQEMFRTANKVTRPEKALILGFMAGSRFVFTFVSFENSMIIPFLFRDNPCPHLGNIVTIKLSENQENVPQTDNTYLTMIVETHFQASSSISYPLFLKQLPDFHIFTDELQHWGMETN